MASKRRADDAQRVLLLELVEETLRAGLLALGVLHQLDDARQGALVRQLRDVDFQAPSRY